MKCPYSDCQKDYNDAWPTTYDSVVPPADRMSQVEKEFPDKLHIEVRTCRFCHRHFYEIHRAHVQMSARLGGFNETIDDEFLFSYPCSKYTFVSKKVPKSFRDAYREAEKCKSIGSLIGLGAALRKAVYELCDAQGVEGDDYREKIGNLPVKKIYQELLKQIKWLGDHTIKPNGAKYTFADADLAFEILPLLADDLYAMDEKAEEASRLLAKVRSRTNSVDDGSPKSSPAAPIKKENPLDSETKRDE